MSGDDALSIFERVVDTGLGPHSPALAKYLLTVDFIDTDRARIAELAAKSSAGALSVIEADEYKGYIAVAELLSRWHSKARGCMTPDVTGP